MGFSFKKTFKKIAEPVKDIAGIITNPAKQIAIVDNALTKGKVTKTFDDVSEGKFSGYAALEFGDKETLKYAIPLASTATGGNFGGLIPKGSGFDMSFFKDLEKNFGLDANKLAGNLLSGLSGSGGTAPAADVLGQTQKAIAISNNQTSDMIASLQKNIMYVVGGVAALVMIIFLLRRKR